MTGGVDGGVARLFAAGGKSAGGVKRAACGINGEDGDGVVAAVGGEEPSAIGMDGDFGGVVAAVEVARDRRDDLELFEGTFRSVIGECSDRGIQLADDVQAFTVGREGGMARSSGGGELGEGGVVGSKRALGGVEGAADEFVEAEVGDEDEAIIG